MHRSAAHAIAIWPRVPARLTMDSSLSFDRPRASSRSGAVPSDKAGSPLLRPRPAELLRHTEARSVRRTATPKRNAPWARTEAIRPDSPRCVYALCAPPPRSAFGDRWAVLGLVLLMMSAVALHFMKLI